MIRKRLLLRSIEDDRELWVYVSAAEGNVPRVSLEFPEGNSLSGQGGDLWEALVVLRLELERLGFLLSCNGSRRNVFPSAMLRQTSGGRLAYALTLPRGDHAGPAVDILDPAGPTHDLTTVALQREWFDAWLASDLDSRDEMDPRERRLGYNKSLGDLVPQAYDVVLHLVKNGRADLARRVERAGDGAVSDVDLLARSSENLRALLNQVRIEGNVKAQVEALAARLGNMVDRG